MGDGKINGNLLVLRRAGRAVVGLSEGGAGKRSVDAVRNDVAKVAESVRVTCEKKLDGNPLYVRARFL